jgi:hypothetical protein
VGNFLGVNSFDKHTITTHYPSLNGQLYASNGLLAHEFVSMPIADKPAATNPTAKFGSLTGIDLNNLAWAILAGTNPQVPHVSVPSFIGELKDLPSLVKGYGDGLLKAVANANLSWRWAIRPMIGDLRKLCAFQKAMNNRLTELYALRTGKVLRRRCHLGKTYLKDPLETNHWYHAGFGVLMRGTLQRFYSKELWGTAQWKIASDSQLPNLGAGVLDNLSRRLTLGLTSHEALATAWELTPWSWLIDWFSNLSDVIAATNNTVGLTWQKICVMRRLRCVTDAKVDRSISTPWVTLDSDFVIEYDRKERYPAFPVLPFPFPTLPIIDNGKMSILASLAALRR